MRNIKNIGHWKNEELDNYIKKWCANISIPKRRNLKMIVVKDIQKYKKKFPMLVVMENGSEIILSLDAFMQGEKL